MRQLGLSLGTALLVLAAGCKTAPEPAPAQASSPVPGPTNEAPPPAPSPAQPEPPASTGSAAPPAASEERTYAEGTQKISAKPGERFRVALPANVTVPMKWHLDPPPDSKLLAIGEEQYFDDPPKGCEGCTGYGGTRVFSFEAKGAGSTSLSFALRPLSEPKGKARKQVTIGVTVE